MKVDTFNQVLNLLLLGFKKKRRKLVYAFNCPVLFTIINNGEIINPLFDYLLD